MRSTQTNQTWSITRLTTTRQVLSAPKPFKQRQGMDEFTFKERPEIPVAFPLQGQASGGLEEGPMVLRQAHQEMQK